MEVRKSEREKLVETLVSFAYHLGKRYPEPGAIIKMQTEKMREKISQLTSEDFKDVRL